MNNFSEVIKCCYSRAISFQEKKYNKYMSNKEIMTLICRIEQSFNHLASNASFLNIPRKYKHFVSFRVWLDTTRISMISCDTCCLIIKLKKWLHLLCVSSLFIYFFQSWFIYLSMSSLIVSTRQIFYSFWVISFALSSFITFLSTKFTFFPYVLFSIYMTINL